MCLFISAGKFTAFLAASVHCFYRLKALAMNIHLASFQIFHPSVCRIHYIPVTISVLRPTFALFGLNLSNHVHDLDQAYKFGSFCRMKLWYNCWFIVHFIWRHLRTFSYLKQSILISYSHKKVTRVPHTYRDVYSIAVLTCFNQYFIKILSVNWNSILSLGLL